MISVHLEDRAHREKLENALRKGNGITWDSLDDPTFRIRYNREQASSADIIRRIINEIPVRDIFVEAEPIEDIIITIYSHGQV